MPFRPASLLLAALLTLLAQSQTHKHLHEDEVIFVHKGAVRVTFNDRLYEAGTGATVFIPHGNWIGVENASTETATILFFFNKPAFENCLRAVSSRPGKKFSAPSAERMKAVREECHEVMRNSGFSIIPDVN